MALLRRAVAYASVVGFGALVDIILMAKGGRSGWGDAHKEALQQAVSNSGTSYRGRGKHGGDDDPLCVALKAMERLADSHGRRVISFVRMAIECKGDAR